MRGQDGEGLMVNRRAWLLLLAVLLVPLVPWLIVGPPVEQWMEGVLTAASDSSGQRTAVGVLGVALLASDSFLPVPSSLVMSALGLALGILVGGMAASLGIFLSGLIAYAVCRKFGVRFAQRIAGEKGLRRVEHVMARLGPLVIAATRAVPLLQEASACLAGLTQMPVRVFVGALLAGSIPTGFAYAAIGASALQHRTLAIALSVALPVFAWVVAFLALRRSNPRPDLDSRARVVK